MPTSYAGRNARSRAELICPSCHTEGLDRFDAFAARHDNPRDKLIHGTRCPNCDQRVPPDKVEEQLAPPEWSFAGLSLTVPSFIRDPPIRAIASITGVLLFLLAFFVIPTMVGPIFGGGTAQTDAPRGGTAVYSDGGWTIYETSNGNYYIYNGTHYLTPTGPSDTAYYYNTEGVARDILDSFLEYDSPDGFEFGGGNKTSDGLPGWSPDNTTTPTNDTDGPSWTYNGTDGGGGGDQPGYQDPSSGDDGSGPGYEDPNDGINQPDDGYTAPTDKEPLHGYVRDSQGNPVNDATITISDTDQEVTTRSDGGYAFDQHLPPGTHEITASHNGLSTPPVTLNTEYNGDITVDGSPDHAVYVEGDDGLVAQNKLSFIMPDSGAANPITLSGTGSNITGTVRFETISNADSASITLSEVRSSELHKVSVTPETPQTIEIDGNTASDAAINLTSTPVSKTVTRNGTTTATATVNLSGNQPTTPTITLAPAIQSGANSKNVTLSSTEQQTRVWVDNEGDTKTPVNVTVTGDTWTQDDHQSGQTDSGFTVDTGGFDAPVGQHGESPTLTMTATDRAVGQTFPGGTPPTQGGTQSTQHQGGYQVDSVFTAPEDGTYRVDWHVHQYINSTIAGSTYQMDRESAESGIMVGERDASGVATSHLIDEDAYVNPTAAAFGPGYDQAEASNAGTTTVQLEEGESIYAGGDTDYEYQGSSSMWGDDEVYTRTNTEVKSVKQLESADDVTISVGGTTKTVSGLQKGETATVSLPLTVGTNDVGVTTSGPVGVEYNLTWAEQYRTSGVTVKQGGETVASISDGFAGTRNLTIPASAMPPGVNEFVLTSPRQADRYNTTLKWTEETVTKQPTVETESGQVLFSQSDRLETEKTVEIDEPIPANETITVTSGYGKLRYNLTYPATVVADAPTVSINNETFQYPGAFNASGSRLTKPVSLNSSALELGQNELRVSADLVDEIQPDVTATVGYNSNLVVTNEPTVTVTNGDGKSHTAEVPPSQLQNGRLTGNATLDLPSEWFTTGKNTVRVRTADGSVVEAKLTARGIHPQEREFTEG